MSKNKFMFVGHGEHILLLDIHTSADDYRNDDHFLWKDEIHKFHSHAGYGIKTYTCYNEEDGSSTLVNFSNVRGRIIGVNHPIESFLSIPIFEQYVSMDGHRIISEGEIKK